MGLRGGQEGRQTSAGNCIDLYNNYDCVKGYEREKHRVMRPCKKGTKPGLGVSEKIREASCCDR